MKQDDNVLYDFLFLLDDNVMEYSDIYCFKLKWLVFDTAYTSKQSLESIENDTDFLLD